MNLQERVETLQMYGPKLLKEAEKQRIRDSNSYYTSANIKKSTETATLDDEVINMLKEIVKALIDYNTHE